MRERVREGRWEIGSVRCHSDKHICNERYFWNKNEKAGKKGYLCLNCF